MFWSQIRIVFNADPDTDADPAFYLNADPDPDSRSQTNAGRLRIQILVRLCRHKKLDFNLKIILYAGNMS